MAVYYKLYRLDGEFPNEYKVLIGEEKDLQTAQMMIELWSNKGIHIFYEKSTRNDRL